MSPETAIDRVRSFIKWRAEKFDALDEVHEPMLESVGWRRGQGEKREFWIRPDTRSSNDINSICKQLK
jgi:hypothetical protein